MSLIEVNLPEIVKKQYLFKLKSYNRIFSSMVVLQIVGILFSLGGTGGGGGGSNNIEYKVSYYSSTTVMFFTFLWAFISAILLTTKANRFDDFSLITTRVCSHLSNFLILLTASILGGLSFFLSGFLLKLIIYFFVNRQVYTGEGYVPLDFLIGITSSVLYVLLFCALGYVTGTLVQLHKGFILLLPGLYIGLIIWGDNNRFVRILKNITEFFTTEQSIILFGIKVIITAGMLFAFAIAISNRMEVKQ